MEEIGGMIVHAEAAQAALDKGFAAHAENLAGAGAVVGDAARGALRPVLADVAAVIGEAHRAGMSLDEKAPRFSNWMLAIMPASGIGAVMLVALSVWVALAWQHPEIAILEQEKADLRGEIATMESVAQNMRAQGLKIEFGDCKEANGRTRRCVAVQPDMRPTMGNRASAVLCAERVLRRAGEESPF
jgi:hypothetical protein